MNRCKDEPTPPRRRSTPASPRTVRTSISRSPPNSALRDFAERHGYRVVREYVDEAESGRIANRRQFRRMLDEAKERPTREVDRDAVAMVKEGL